MADDPDRDLHRPATPPVAAAVVLHPHPGMGGDRHHPLVVGVCERLAADGVAALRPDLPDPSVPASAAALETMADALRTDVGVERLFLVGYSWGSAVAAAAQPAGVERRVLVAPPAGLLPVAIAGSEPALVLVPAHDQYGPPEEVRAAVGDRPGTTIEVVEGCDHFLLGAVGRIADRTVAWLTGG